MKIKNVISLALLIVVVFTSCQEEVKVACVGDSITEGSGIKDQCKNSYPVVLDKILGNGYNVLNCGRSGATMLKDSYLPYWRCNELYNTMAFNPDVVIIKLGTNDSKTSVWNAEAFEKDYQSMVDTLRTLKSNPKIYACLPVPAYQTEWGISDSTITQGVIPIVKSIAEKNNLEIIDLYSALTGKAELFPDGIHPNEEGARLMAEAVAKNIIK